MLRIGRTSSEASPIINPQHSNGNSRSAWAVIASKACRLITTICIGLPGVGDAYPTRGQATELALLSAGKFWSALFEKRLYPFFKILRAQHYGRAFPLIAQRRRKVSVKMLINEAFDIGDTQRGALGRKICGQRPSGRHQF